MKKRYTCLALLFIALLVVKGSYIAQGQIVMPVSIHQEQSEYFKSGASLVPVENSIQINNPYRIRELSKRVFGYHPYWSGNVYRNYRWELLSDLCYFSYEVDPYTGNAITTHNFETAPVIDTALSKGVKVHLCVTLFSNHSVFFNNPAAQQTLVNNLIALVEQRGIHGINIDFEAVSSSQSAGLTAFMQLLSSQLKSVKPDAELSIAAPAVNWSNTFDIPSMVPWVDLFMIMTYDYYWNGSTVAGPVASLWPFTSSFEYSVSHSITYYQSQGVEVDKILMGVPYYGRDWPVVSNSIPAQTTGSGIALLYRNIVGSGNIYYKPENYYWDKVSGSSYYSYNSGMLRQTFFDDVKSLGLKYNMVNRRNLAGIGIWALGYDDGRSELWDLLEEKFAANPAELCRDTIYDTGGPFWLYKNNEDYIETVHVNEQGPLRLVLLTLDLEPGFDSLWIYDGNTVNSELIAALSGNLPVTFNTGDLSLGNLSYVTSNNVFTIRFRSNSSYRSQGYAIEWSCPTQSTGEILSETDNGIIYPNPAKSGELIKVLGKDSGFDYYYIYDQTGRPVTSGKYSKVGIKIPDVKGGFYILKLQKGNSYRVFKLVVNQ